jgi:hypothetical protein
VAAEAVAFCFGCGRVFGIGFSGGDLASANEAGWTVTVARNHRAAGGARRDTVSVEHVAHGLPPRAVIEDENRGAVADVADVAVIESNDHTRDRAAQEFGIGLGARKADLVLAVDVKISVAVRLQV